VAETGGTDFDNESAWNGTIENVLKISLFQVFNITSNHEK
jgi:hypothetical protein